MTVQMAKWTGLPYAGILALSPSDSSVISITLLDTVDVIS